MDDPSPSDLAPEKVAVPQPRRRFQFSLRPLFVLTLVAAVASAVAAYFVRRQAAIDNAWKRMNMVKSIADKVLGDENVRLKKQGLDVLEGMDSSCSLEDGYDRTTNFEDGGNSTSPGRSATAGVSTRRPTTLVGVHIKAKLLEPVELDNLGGKETAAVIDKITAELEKAGISVQKGSQLANGNQ